MKKKKEAVRKVRECFIYRVFCKDESMKKNGKMVLKDSESQSRK